jgi:hypothetical protein
MTRLKRRGKTHGTLALTPARWCRWCLGSYRSRQTERESDIQSGPNKRLETDLRTRSLRSLASSAQPNSLDINVEIRRKVSELERLVNEAQRPKPN